MTKVVDVPLGKSGIAGYAIDIQDLENAQKEKRLFAESQREMLDKISAAVVQFDADKSLKFCNLPFQRIFSMRQQWIAERPEFPRVLDRMREMNRIPEVREFPEWREERTAWFQSTESIEENWLLADGTHLRVIANPTPDGGLMLIFEDRTEQVQLASARDTLLRVRTATFDNLFESLAVFAADGKINIWNHQFARNWELDEDDLSKHPRIDALMQKMAGQLKQPAKISEVREMVRRATTEREQKSGRINFADGRRFEFAAIPLPDGNALFTMLDISDSYRIEQALRERNEALVEADSIKGSFLSNMSYEFRTPLTSIGGFAELLDNEIAGPLTEQGHEYTRAILQSVKRLGTQIDNVLDLSQSEAGALPIAKDKVNLNKLIEDIAAQFAEEAKVKEIEIELQLDEKLGSALADKKRLTQAIAQIVDNAIRYTGKGGRILINGTGNVKQAVIHISDNGPGMTAGQQSKAFDSFARSRKQNKARKQKTGKNVGGLGLPLARQLVLAHGGDLKLTSEPKQGTLVSIRLPTIQPMIISDEADMIALGRKLGTLIRTGDKIALTGTLGAGKTTFARGVLRGLGFTEEVPSPTFAIVQQYDPPDTRLSIAHVDFYRIEKPDEIRELGIDDILIDGAIMAEWPDRMAASFWTDALQIELKIQSEATRQLTWTAGPAWKDRWPII